MALFSKENFTREGAKNNLKKFAAGAKTALKKRWWVMLIELAALAIMLLADLLIYNIGHITSCSHSW